MAPNEKKPGAGVRDGYGSLVHSFPDPDIGNTRRVFREQERQEIGGIQTLITRRISVGVTHTGLHKQAEAC